MWFLIFLIILVPIAFYLNRVEDGPDEPQPSKWPNLIALGIGFGVITMLTRFPDESRELLSTLSNAAGRLFG